MKEKDDPKLSIVSFEDGQVQTKTIHTNPDQIANRIAKVVQSFHVRYYVEPLGIILGLLDYIDLLAFVEKHKAYESSNLNYVDRFIGLSVRVSGAIRGIDIEIHPSQALRLAPGIVREASK